MPENDAQLARRLLGDVLNGGLKWTPDMRLRIATVAQALASLTIADELRRLNEGRDQWYREVLEVLTRAKDGDVSSLHSEQPAAAPGCPVCGNLNMELGEECLFEMLTRAEWKTHRQHLFETALSFRTEESAAGYADQRMLMDFGPCPEES